MREIFKNLYHKFNSENLFGKYSMITSLLVMPTSGLYFGYKSVVKDLDIIKDQLSKYENKIIAANVSAGVTLVSFIGGFTVGILFSTFWPLTCGFYCHDKYLQYKRDKMLGIFKR